jgi:hypothetical protein
MHSNAWNAQNFAIDGFGIRAATRNKCGHSSRDASTEDMLREHYIGMIGVKVISLVVAHDCVVEWTLAVRVLEALRLRTRLTKHTRLGAVCWV